MCWVFVMSSILYWRCPILVRLKLDTWDHQSDNSGTGNEKQHRDRSQLVETLPMLQLNYAKRGKGSQLWCNSFKCGEIVSGKGKFVVMMVEKKTPNEEAYFGENNLLGKHTHRNGVWFERKIIAPEVKAWAGVATISMCHLFTCRTRSTCCKVIAFLQASSTIIMNASSII